MIKKLLQKLIMPMLALLVCLPAQAGMVGTAQIQDAAVTLPAAATAQQRDWISEQLVRGGVSQEMAIQRVAAMTDSQVAELHQRIDEAPAGGLDAIVWIVVILIFTEYMGYTDIFPSRN